MHFSVNVILSAKKFGRPIEEIIKEYRETGEYPDDVEEVVSKALDPFWEELEVEEATETCWECGGDDEPRENCEVCEGTGLITRLINPNALWDWWEIGGRWSVDGGDIWIAGAPDMPEGARDVPHTVVLDGGDGKGHYWFDTLPEGASYEEYKPRMQEAWGELMERHKGDIVVRVDCHI